MKRKLLAFMLLGMLMLSLFPSRDVHADVAPPQMPPGANLNPGEEVTQVRMVAETVIIDVRQDPQDAKGAIANTVAMFTMRNLGTTEESMQARFPLSFSTGGSDGFGNYPEIGNIAVKVNGNPVPTRREMQPGLPIDPRFTPERAEIPWAVFDVTFPPGQDVTIEVSYPVNGFGYYPYEAFRYILETGAGWNDTIGTVDIIVRLPYDATAYNIWLTQDTTGYSSTTPNATLSGRDIRWHYENLEPTQENNIEVTVVAPSLWQKILTETENVTRNINDGEAWGRLGKAYKEITVMHKGYLREDTGGQEIFNLSRRAYERCLELLPEDALWQYGYADLLWAKYYFDVYMAGQPDTESLLPRILSALKTSLELDPNNELAKEKLLEISYSIPGSVEISDSGYVFLGLTATPIPPTPYVFITETPVASPTIEITATSTASDVAVPSVTPTSVPTPQPTASPLCGGGILLLPLLFGSIWLSKQR